MRRYGTLRRTAALATALSLAFAPVAVAGTRYDRMVAKVADMVNDERATTTVNAYGLQLLNVLWEAPVGGSTAPSVPTSATC